MIKLFRAGRLAAAIAASLSVATTAHAEQVLPALTPVAAATRVVGTFAAPALPAATPATVKFTLPAPKAPAVPLSGSLSQMVAGFTPGGELDEAGLCLAKAVYFEARGESLEGQLAVAEVVLNRASSGVYPSQVCEVVTQKSQFSFIRHGRFPRPDESSESWRKAVAIAHIARNNLADAVPSNVLWYHADYVSPPWGRRLTKVTRIGTHIFYS